jgi:hypothetical protein
LGGKAQGSSKTSREKDQWSPQDESCRPEAHIGSGEEKMGSAEGEGGVVIRVSVALGQQTLPSSFFAAHTGERMECEDCCFFSVL